MPYWAKYIVAIVALILIIRFVTGLYEKLKRKLIRDYKNEQAWGGFGRGFLMNPKVHKALEREKFYIAREFFLGPGVIKRRSSPGTDEDD